MALWKRITLIWLLHLSLTVGIVIGGTFFAAETIRAGNTEWSTEGKVLRKSAIILAEPMASIAIRSLQKESLWFWPLLSVNSLIWALGISIAWQLYGNRNVRATPNK